MKTADLWVIEGRWSFDMTIQQFDFIDIGEKAKTLGCNIPTGLALLPRNFADATAKDELLHESSALDVRKLFRKNGIEETPLESNGESFLTISEKGFQEWIGPVIFVSLAAYSQNPHIVSVSLGVISNYLTDWFRGVVGERNVRLDIVVETRRGATYKRVHYEGPLSSIEQAAEFAEKVISGE